MKLNDKSEGFLNVLSCLHWTGRVGLFGRIGRNWRILTDKLSVSRTLIRLLLLVI